MAQPYESQADGTVAFLPHRLNRQPVVVRGLTADERWICAGLSAAAGLVAGIPLALLFSAIALVPTLVVLGIALGVFVGGAVMRRQKRNRPETWLYRQAQWRASRQLPWLAPWVGEQMLVMRSGVWSVRRSRP